MNLFVKDEELQAFSTMITSTTFTKVYHDENRIFVSNRVVVREVVNILQCEVFGLSTTEAVLVVQYLGKEKGWSNDQLKFVSKLTEISTVLSDSRGTSLRSPQIHFSGGCEKDSWFNPTISS